MLVVLVRYRCTECLFPCLPFSAWQSAASGIGLGLLFSGLIGLGLYRGTNRSLCVLLSLAPSVSCTMKGTQLFGTLRSKRK